MKTLSRRFEVVALVAIGLAAAFSLRAFGQESASPTQSTVPEAAFVLNIQKPTEVKNHDADHFKQVLKKLKTQLYDIDLVDEHSHHEHIVPDAKAEIKTDKVTVANDVAAGEFTFIQVRTSRQIASNSVSDIQAVLNELQ